MKELTLREIQNLLGYEVKIVEDKPVKRLADVGVGETFKVGDLEFIVLEHTGLVTNVILKNFLVISKFDPDSSNYAESRIRRQLNTVFFNKLAYAVGEKNIIKHEVDLTTDDGRKEYGSVFDYVSLLTCDMYRKYVTILSICSNFKEWWWLATSLSTVLNDYGSTVRCAGEDGVLLYRRCDRLAGVRPFCVLKSDIFVGNKND